MQIIDTRKVNCRDCHRCLRVCPVKAIGLFDGRTKVLDDRCILCGRCVVECPQHAKNVMSHLPLVRRAIEQGRKVVLSLGSAYLGLFSEYAPTALLSELRGLGFAEIAETAEAAEVVASLYRQMFAAGGPPIISSNCPVVVRLIKKYYPSLTKRLAPVVSPMTAHGLMLKQRFGEDAFIVFAGPCIGKFSEWHRHFTVDAVLTFGELGRWLREAKPTARADTSRAQRPEPTDNARFFPLAGGILKSFMDFDNLSTAAVAVDGIENCIDVFTGVLEGKIAPRFIEAFSCAGGCIGGPAGGSAEPLALRRLRMIERANALEGKAVRPLPRGIDFSSERKPEPIEIPMPTEEQIRAILHKTGKFTRADEKNCGACGYNSCREKAIAVCQGVAEITMCMPYMRSKAESFAGVIVEHAPYGIVVLDKNMRAQDFNPELERMFGGENGLTKEMDFREVMDCGAFVSALRGNRKIVSRVSYADYGVIAEQIIIPVPKNALVIGIIEDVTEREKAARKWNELQEETADKATEIIKKQMKVAQEIAGLLGETTAETKSALLELIQVLKQREDG